ncbi:MAG: hypothetical protein IJ306_04220 [Oscillospiraceae bacterium]|nr:hypothetical protein [Oscillospiraceae bacterium]
MYKEIKCLRCDKTMEFVKKEFLQLGSDGYLSRNNRLAGALYCDIYICPECGEYHFIKAGDESKDSNAKLIKCKFCLKKYHESYPHCPICGHRQDEEW